MFPTASPAAWSDSRTIGQASDTLVQMLTERWPQAAALVCTNPLAGLSHVDGLTVVDDPTARLNECPIDGTYDPVTATIVYRQTGFQGRDNFTLLHELGHHLLAINEDWSFDIAPELDRAGVGKTVEELLVSTFASRILIPDETAAAAFASGVASRAVAELHRNTEASATACLVRALSEPGDRLVMLTDFSGTPWFAQTTGEPYSPGKRTRQPAIEAAALRAAEGTGTYRLTDGDGLRFGTGNVNHRVVFDVTVKGGFVFVIVETTLPDLRLREGREQWHLDCLAGCGHTFTPNDSLGTCLTCSEPKCSRCQGCECRKVNYCARCTLTLPTARALAGHTLCDECE